jgi:hypothetical protein
MKTLLACLCLLSLTAFANDGPLPAPSGDKPRFTVTSGMIDHGAGPVPTFVRLDTHTGQTWMLQQIPFSSGNGAMLHVWVVSQEVGSEIYEFNLKALVEKSPKAK